MNQQSESSRAKTDGEIDMPSYVDTMKVDAARRVGCTTMKRRQSKHGTGGRVMNSPILDALCLAHHPRWIVISDAKGWVRLVCSNCGEPKTCRKKNIPKVCPGCKKKMGGE